MKKMLLWYVPLIGIIVSSCVKEPLNNLSEDESRIYITNYDTSAAFTNYKTFSIADSVAVVSNNRLQSREHTPYDEQLVTEVINALQQRGFQRVSTADKPDLGVTVSRVTNTATGVVSYTDYGGYYNSYYDPYMWGYPDYSYYFPTYYGTYQINENALTVDMFDLKNSKQNNEIKDVWSGIVRGEGVFQNNNVSSQVQALFNQSPYLKNQ